MAALQNLSRLKPETPTLPRPRRSRSIRRLPHEGGVKLGNGRRSRRRRLMGYRLSTLLIGQFLLRTSNCCCRVVGETKRKHRDVIFVSVLMMGLLGCLWFPNAASGVFTSYGRQCMRPLGWLTGSASTGDDVMVLSRHVMSNWISQQPMSDPWWKQTRHRIPCEENTADRQIQTVRGLLHRRFPSLGNRVRFSRKIQCLQGGCFEVKVEDDVLCIRGSSGVELANGLHWFIKEACHGLSTWEKTGGTQYREDCLNPDHMSSLKDVFCLKRSRNVPLQFYQNVVTSSYSMAFWNWTRWEAEIDWMALHGVNLPLALMGQEFIWVEVYRQLGVVFEDLADFFTGPAFLSWGRMGNIQGYAGPLPWSYIEGQAGHTSKTIIQMSEQCSVYQWYP